MWSSRPSPWIVAASLADIALVPALALSGTLMAPLSLAMLGLLLVAAGGLAFVLDQIKLPVLAIPSVRPALPRTD